LREDICTIPVTDVFQKTDGCPICRMQRQVEDKIITYIMGAAMMEPDVRTETNRQGFCDRHLEEMYSRNGKLQLALILESRIDELINAAKKGGDRLSGAISGCFVCGKVAWGLEHMFETIYKSYENDSDFRRMFQDQPFLCPSHCAALCRGVTRKNMKSYGRDFIKLCCQKTEAGLIETRRKVHGFTELFDYRNAADAAMQQEYKTAVSEAVDYLSLKRLK